jgi:competence protein ComEA
MSPRERNALLLLLVLGLGGHAVRPLLTRSSPSQPPFDSASFGDPAEHRERVLAGTRPLAQGETIDVDRADQMELRRLPGVGPALAARIVADREERGPFGGPEGLDRVPGIGSALLARLAPHLRFSGVRAETGVNGSADRISLNGAGAAELQQLPGIGPARARSIVAFRDTNGSFRDLAELGRVPGMPASLVERLKPLLRLD